MKIGILTQPLGHNYGGVLQAYALQYVLKKLGHEAIIADYFPWQRWMLSCLNTLLSRICGRSKNFTISPSESRKKYTHIYRFIEQYMVVATINYPPVRRSFINKYKLEILVVGSDQVWRPRYNRGVLKDMFLSFAKDTNIRRIAYAASFGSDKWEYSPKQEKACKMLARKFDAISVREVSGVKLCEEHLGVSAELVLDPTLLLEKEVYEDLCKKESRAYHPFLLAYILDMDEAKSQLIKSEADKQGLNIRLVEGFPDKSIEEWLSNFRNADFVITDSFHGTVFSVIFNKEFYSITNEERGSSRFKSLLQPLHLEDRMVVPQMDLNATIIDWADINILLSRMRNDCCSFLLKNL